MPNLNAALREEITRIARKVVRSQVSPVKASSAAHRRSIARLKREIESLRRELVGLRRRPSGSATPEPADEAASIRFSARSVVAQRKRLGLSAENFARLVGVTGQTIYNWESGKRPRPAQLQALAGVRTIGRREAVRRLEATEPKAPSRRNGARRKRRARR